MKYIANCSMGKDSLALVLKLLELGYPLDEVIFFATGIDFSCIMKNAERLKALLEEKNIKFTVLTPNEDFLYVMTEKPIHKRTGEIQKGCKWCGGMCRWGTAMKLEAIKKHYKSYGDEAIVEYVGIAADERERINRKRNGNMVKLYPLVEWEMKEADCLQYCYEKGWNWQEEGYELYDLLDRVSCKYCRNKNLSELRNIYLFLPNVWQELKDLQDKVEMPYRDGKTIHDLERRFMLEAAQISLFEYDKNFTSAM